MITCPKCGFKNEKLQATDCPKCGLIYAKFQKAKEEQIRHMSAEHALRDSLSKAVTEGQDEEPKFLDFESGKDQSSYPAITYLSWFFIGFSGVLGLVWVVEIKFFWSLLDSFFQLKGPDKLFITIFFAIFSSLPIAIYLSVGGALKLGKDIADNTRASRSYLAHIANKMK